MSRTASISGTARDGHPEKPVDSEAFHHHPPPSGPKPDPPSGPGSASRSDSASSQRVRPSPTISQWRGPWALPPSPKGLAPASCSTLTMAKEAEYGLPSLHHLRTEFAVVPVHSASPAEGSDASRVPTRSCSFWVNVSSLSTSFAPGAGTPASRSRGTAFGRRTVRSLRSCSSYSPSRLRTPTR